MSRAEGGAVLTHTRVAEVMTTNAVAVREFTPYKQIALELLRRRVSAFPVIDDDHKVVGVVSAADLLAKQALAGNETPRRSGLSGPWHRRELGKATALTATGLMTAPAVTVGPDCPVYRAARLMSARHVKQLPVVDPAGRLVGIISRSDTLAVFRRSDADIMRAIVEDVIVDGFFMDPAAFTITVKNGVVTLECDASTAVVSSGIAEEARHLEGVVAVRERIEEPGA